MQVQDCKLWQLFVDAFEYMVVQVPRLVQFCILSGLPELLQPLVRLRQLLAIGLQPKGQS